MAHVFFIPFQAHCEMRPTVVSEVSWDQEGNNAHQFNAYRALTNTDKNDSFANWVGKDGQPAYFVYDLGCRALLTRVDLRNSCNGAIKDR